LLRTLCAIIIGIIITTIFNSVVSHYYQLTFNDLHNSNNHNYTMTYLQSTWCNKSQLIIIIIINTILFDTFEYLIS
jgi:retron-type reverse transcriptase